MTNIRNLLMALAIAILTVVSIMQDMAITRAVVTIREMSDNPACMVGPVWQGKTPQGKHKKYYISDN